MDKLKILAIPFLLAVTFLVWFAVRPSVSEAEMQAEELNSDFSTDDPIVEEIETDFGDESSEQSGEVSGHCTVQFQKRIQSLESETALESGHLTPFEKGDRTPSQCQSALVYDGAIPKTGTVARKRIVTSFWFRSTSRKRGR